MSAVRIAALLAALGCVLAGAAADPCGMVPPVWTGEGPAITRVGAQITYVFYKNGIESFVIRPGFQGKVEEFGMLIPFPTPPALRKVDDNVFAHVAAAIDPPEVLVHLGGYSGVFSDRGKFSREGAALSLGRAEVRVLRQEAVGMYDVAVLEAGSAGALRRWMAHHGFRYPAGMDRVCDEYVTLRWCFVAVKTRVGRKADVEPRPGMRDARPGFPAGASFDGHVQGMGFRFRAPDLVVPMRLSAYNDGRLRNIVYLLAEGPRAIRGIPKEQVVRQIPGRVIYRNLTAPLPVRIVGGTVAGIPAERWARLQRECDPTPHNGLAADLFAGDLAAAREGSLVHEYEEREKTFLSIGERLGMRGPQLDRLHRDTLEPIRRDATGHALGDLFEMTMTVLDGDFPREVLARENLRFEAYSMPADRNSASHYDARVMGPRRATEEEESEFYPDPHQSRAIPMAGPTDPQPGGSRMPPWWVWTGLAVCFAAGIAVIAHSYRPERKP